LKEKVEGLPKYDLSNSGIDRDYYLKKEEIINLLKE